MTFNWLDIIIIILAIAAAVSGYHLGFARQVLSTIGLLLAIWLMTFLYQPLENLFSFISDVNTRDITLFVVALLIVSAITGIFAGLGGRRLRTADLGIFDDITGIILALFQFALIVEFIIITALLFPVPGLTDAIAHSTASAFLLDQFGFAIFLFPNSIHMAKCAPNIACVRIWWR
jgi:uncharacterized membrane protein required for colicin V production